MADKRLCEFDVICSEISKSLTGLKAIQREAKKATKALKELEETCKSVKTDE
ncbi:hypothetical protein PZE06_21810 [Robertmurraya sp. DFI.2.37]|uniref:hypothetical protein n=1 Tax=Robertmurraya sp. DFI.2.37 TaxID=3031819 RepID=UPI001784AFCA|nr:hypothetical protein [Robertmurraya sp. DFI.2.37]MDF1510774.1 hypothetical protein [Robertmurraya sp. DFI.2.37]